MRYMTIALTLWLAIPAEAQEPKGPAGFPVMLSPGDPTSKTGPRYSPKGRQLALASKAQNGLSGFDHLETRLTLGPNAKTTPGMILILARSEKGKPYDLLFVDADGSGKVSDVPVKAAPKLVRDKYWSNFEATVRVNHARPGEAVDDQAYPISLWAVVDKEGDAPDVLRISRRGFLTGSAEVRGQSFEVILSDSDNDGILTRGDWWELRSKGSKADGMRTVGDFAWAGGKAWMLELDGTNGRKATLVAFDPGMTEEEDLAKRDTLRVDRMAVRATKPIPFRKDADAALKDAAAKKVAHFIKFETDWCGPCKTMAEYVFTAKDVADAAEGITCVIVDGDERKDLTEKHAVKAYPTGILFDAQGKEIARYVGYQGVKETAEFLKKRTK